MATTEHTMHKTDIFTKILAAVGTLLAWFPIAATIALSAIVAIARGVFRLDYLMPAELFPAALAGGGLLLWAALRAHARRAFIGWGLALMVGLLIGGQALAVVTGLASGAIEPAGWPWVLVIASLIAYTLTLAAIGIAGVLLLRDLFQHEHPS
jgi:hypothetical protein